MRILRLLAVLAFLPLLFSPGNAQQKKAQAPAAASPGSATGTAIGNGIKAAITTAFPAISTIINAIWPGANNGNKRKSDATTATSDLKARSVQGQSQINAITGDLDAVAVFLGSCVVAEDHVIAMRTTLRLKPVLNATEELEFKNHWTVASQRLATLKSTGSLIDNVSDTYIQTTLQAIADANLGLISSIDNDVKAGSAGYPQLSNDLALLDSQLAAVNALSGVIIGNVSFGLKGAREVAAQGQGATQMSAAERALQEEFESSLKTRFPKLATK
jgi:hypothetical protein